MTKREKYSWIYWLCVLLLFIGLQRLLFPNTQGPIELTYSEFLDSVRAGNVQRIVFLPEKIIGYLVPKTLFREISPKHLRHRGEYEFPVLSNKYKNNLSYTAYPT